jgi:hypothetical protein
LILKRKYLHQLQMGTIKSEQFCRPFSSLN